MEEDGTPLGRRSWAQVPRRGDILEVDGKDPKERLFLTVMNVYWRKAHDGGPAVDLMCRRGKHAT